MKIKLLITTGILLAQTVAFAQWSGTNPENLNGSANLTGDLSVGSAFVPLPVRRINLYKSFTGLPAAGAPLSDYTTGLKITHRFSPTGSSFTNYNWEMAADKEHLYFHYGNDNRTLMTMKSDGNIGIGIINPSYKLHVVNTNLNGGTAFRADAINGHIRLFETDGSNPSVNFTQIERNADAFHIYQNDGTGYQHALTADMDGNISIGTTNSEGYKLAVKGNVIAEEIVVKLYADWPDYVFAKKYGLMSLNEVEDYINENSHLPNVPSAEEIKEEGINLGEMDAILLRKIEELTLYIIELKKENDEVKEELKSLK